ncbi:xanthine dehydrogenase family protein molybdopterin-binding subunit [Noviherbaspirillum pedocola]|uniref:Xanthine dehydrogenase family protein molybdopterin-binding subunit n=1 Tax=Noviherbaspirillum pedocola TaxID=2801341 RepID=A0A934SVL5_9BURK|nr:xanthine dehydrogenase family protein molybdopterin-binding subunit [Noviherbaspirillum pedocola]MBK4737400.1 xanthine dehydrogenase family protein molybdopterin-binding subunit [Noviherbaspirillum pedocola]
MSTIGQGVDRVDGRDKVTGRATYAAEHRLPGIAHAVLVTSTIASGRIVGIDAGTAERMRGVVLVMTHRNAPKLPKGGRGAVDPPAGRVLNLLQDDEVLYSNQPVALVVAETLEQARDAARAVRVHYAAHAPTMDFDRARFNAAKPEKAKQEPADSRRGDLQAGIDAAAEQIDVGYRTPMEHHNPMEPHATIAAWEGEHLTLYDSTQYVSGDARTVAKVLGLPNERVRVICPYVGGGFGCKGSTWSHVVLAAMAAKSAGRPVKLVLDRPQMFGPVGGRPETEQRLLLAASADGALTAVRHNVIAASAFQEDWLETSAIVTRMLYACGSQETTHRLARLNIGTPTFMRAPGEATGSFALECAMDELAYELKMDPIALRLRNYAETEPEKGKPFSRKELRECYRQGAERFGWTRRDPRPMAMRNGNLLVGMGMATATYPANRKDARASARILADGSAVLASGTQDLGTGTYTVMTQVAADALGLPISRVRFELGDSSLPQAPVSGGSQSVASVAPAVQQAATAARTKLVGMALADRASPLFEAAPGEVQVENGFLFLQSAPDRRDSYAAIIARHGGKPVAAESAAEPGDEKEKYALHSFGAVFAEVHVDPELGTIRVPRIVGAYDVGQLLNEKTGRSQLIGGIVWGVGMALMETTEYDMRYGRPVNNNLAEYHVPVNADIGDIDIIVLPGKDPVINALGTRGIGEIGITGVAAAIANAVYHATGKRVRELPITLDKVMV